MKYRILSARALNRKDKLRICMRWFLYFLLLLLFYIFMVTGTFRLPQAPLLVPLAIAVSMQEREFSGSVFGVICGLFLDTASHKVMGFFSIWLMPCCLLTALLCMNLIRPNIINHLWLTASTFLVLGGMDYIFNYLIWDIDHTNIVLMYYIILPYAIALLCSPLVFLLTRKIARKFNYIQTETQLKDLDRPEELS